MNQTQIDAIREIERQLQILWAAELPAGPTIYNAQAGDDLQVVLDSRSEEIIDLGGQTFTRGSLNVKRPVTVRNGVIQATANVNDLVNITASDVKLSGLTVRGDGTTKRGIAANGSNMLFENIEVRNIRRAGQETNGIAMWNGTKLTVRNSVIEGGSQSFLAGGATPDVPNHVAEDLLFENCVFTRPIEWKGQGYACKNAFELKSARRVLVKNCVLENVWVEGQSGFAIVLTASQYGNSPETIVEDVEFNSCEIRNVGSGLNAVGFTQHSDPLRQTLRGNNFRFINNAFVISKALYGGQGTLMQLSHEPDNILWEGNNVIADGDAFIRLADSKPITNFCFVGNNVNKAGTYGIFSPLGTRGVGFSTYFPSGILQDNAFTGWHSTFKANFPTNTYIV